MVKYKTKVDASGTIVAFWDQIGEGQPDGTVEDDGGTIRDIEIDPGPFDRTTYYWSDGWQRRPTRPSKMYDWVDGSWTLNASRATAQQKQRLNNLYQEYITNKLLRVGDITWQASAIEVVAMEIVAGSWDSVTLNDSGNIEWKDADNVYHEFTEAEFAELVKDIKTAYVVRRDTAFRKLQELKESLPLADDNVWLTTDWNTLL